MRLKEKMINSLQGSEKPVLCVAVLECAYGEGQHWQTWTETRVCNDTTTIGELLEWKRKFDYGMRLSITVPSP